VKLWTTVAFGGTKDVSCKALRVDSYQGRQLPAHFTQKKDYELLLAG